MYKRSGLTVIVLFVSILMSSSAHAHAAIKGATDFYSGLLHPLTALDDILPIFALGLLAGQNDGLQRSEAILWVFPIFFAAGAWIELTVPTLHGIMLVNVLSVVLFGLMVAAAWTLPTWCLIVPATLFALSHGYANGSAIDGQIIKPWLFIAGTATGAFIALAYGLLIAEYLLRQKQTWPAIAVRVAGSWVAAIGLLVLSITHKALLLS